MVKSAFGSGSLERRRSERRRLRRSFWADVRWWVMGLLLFGAALVGYLGFRDYQAAVGGPDGVLDILYRDLQLFVFESGALEVTTAIPASLQVARFLAPFALVLFAQQTLATLFREHYQLLRSLGHRGHTVVCGLGHRGLEVARSLHERGHRVVAIDKDGTLDHVEVCRAAGVPVIVGDATDDAVLRRAGAGRAARLVALCGDDAVNAKIVTGVRRLVEDGSRRTGFRKLVSGLVGDRRSGPPECLVHIYGPQLCTLLRASNQAGADGSPLPLRFVNTFQSGAQALLLRHPPFPDVDPPGGAPSHHVLVIGLGWMGASLVEQIARLWYLTRQGRQGRVRVSVVDLKADALVPALQTLHPEIGEHCQVDPVTLDVNSGSFADGGFTTSHAPPITAAYVCFDDEARSLEAAMVLRRSVPAIPIVVRALTRSGLPALLDRGVGNEDDDLSAFALVDRVLGPDLLLGGDDEVIARALHDDFCRRETAKGWRYGPVRDDRHKPSLADWEDLAEGYRRSNREQAAHTDTKLAAVRSRREASDDWEPLVSFTNEEVDELARMEHDRWLDERAAHRHTFWRRVWPWSTTGDDHPDAKDFDDLDEEIQEIDKDFVRNTPLILAKLGYRIVRVPPSP